MSARFALAALSFAIASAAFAESPSRVPGEKLDAGLGALPPYVEWAAHPVLVRYTEPEVQAMLRDPNHVVGEKLDSGLGELPPYRDWHAHPELRRYARPPVVAAR